MPNETEIVLEYTHFGEIGQGMARDIDRVCEANALDIQARAQMAIQNPPKSGRTYRHGNVLHQASAPGQAPATDTANLVMSAYTKQIASSDYETGFTAEYARPLEFGTARILPRPFLRPAVEAVRARFVAAIKRIVER